MRDHLTGFLDPMRLCCTTKTTTIAKCIMQLDLPTYNFITMEFRWSKVDYVADFCSEL